MALQDPRRAFEPQLLNCLVKIVDLLVGDHRASGGQRFEAIEALPFGYLGGPMTMRQAFPSALRQDLFDAALLSPGTLFDRQQDIVGNVEDDSHGPVVRDSRVHFEVYRSPPP